MKCKQITSWCFGFPGDTLPQQVKEALQDWVNPIYLSEEALCGIYKKFFEDGSIQLQDFLVPSVIKKLQGAVIEQDMKEFNRKAPTGCVRKYLFSSCFLEWIGNYPSPDTCRSVLDLQPTFTCFCQFILAVKFPNYVAVVLHGTILSKHFGNKVATDDSFLFLTLFLHPFYF